MHNERRTILIQLGLFLATFVTTTLGGAEFVYGHSIFAFTKDNGIGWNAAFSWNDFRLGMNFSVPFLLVLTVHEFGHYFTAIYHKVKTSLPYYIPFPSTPILPSIGTLGAIIRIREQIKSNVKHFDIGLAGPLAGFIVALVIIAYGFLTLPPADYIYQFHPEYKEIGKDYAKYVYDDAYLKSKKQSALDFQLGDNLVFLFFKRVVADPERIPNTHEVMHYPALLAGLLSLLFTAMNLLPIGQLDGGHITYGLFGARKHRIVATVFFVLLIFYTGLGMVNIHGPRGELMWEIPATIFFYFICLWCLHLPWIDRIMYALLIFAVQAVINWLYPELHGYMGWLLLVVLISRFVGIQHPPAEIEERLDSKRVVLGWIALIIFAISFSPLPLVIQEIGLIER